MDFWLDAKVLTDITHIFINVIFPLGDDFAEAFQTKTQDAEQFLMEESHFFKTMLEAECLTLYTIFSSANVSSSSLLG